jgi:hypothetical protein
MIKVLTGFMDKNNNSRLRYIIHKFDKYRRIELIKMNIMKKLMATSAGKVMVIFSKWRALPELKDRNKINRANVF